MERAFIVEAVLIMATHIQRLKRVSKCKGEKSGLGGGVMVVVVEGAFIVEVVLTTAKHTNRG